MTTAAPLRRIWAVVPAAGRGERFDSSASKGPPKQYAPLQGSTVIEWSLRALLAEPRVEKIVVAVAADDSRWPALAGSLNERHRAPAGAASSGGKVLSAIGGASRQESVLKGLKRLRELAAADDWVLVHDAARPCLEEAEVSALIEALDQGAGGAVLAAPIVDTVKRESGGEAAETVDRRGLWRALTPQAFALGALEHALEEAARSGITVTDEAQAMERLGARAHLVQGSPFNIKVTRAADLCAASRILQPGRGASTMRIGQGFDVHTFGEGDHVMLGGVRVPYGRGVVAHSDGDVVIHALCDALLGALGEGDIGRHFPDSDPRYRGADSRVFLRTVAEMMRTRGMKLVNADITVLAEAPRIAAHRAAMAEILAADLGAAAAHVNIKATTTERMGFVGRGEGLAALASVLIDSA